MVPPPHPNLNVIKLPSAPLLKRSVVNRAIQYFAFSGKALHQGLRLWMAGQAFQSVLGSSPPLLVGLVAWLLSLTFRAELLLEVRDLWSQTMAANGFIKNRLAIDLNRALESFLYAQARKIIVVSGAFTDEIETQVPGSAEKTVLIPNGADLEFFQHPRLWGGSYLRQTPAERALFQVVYAGVFSDYTRLETVLEAARLLRDDYPQIRFNLAGGGYQFDKLKQDAANLALDNVVFWETLPKNRISKFIMEGDLSLINYRALDVFAQVLPNKLFDYLAAGRPILASVLPGEISRVLEAGACGLSVPPESPEALAEKILWFYRHQTEGLKMGRRGQAYVRSHYNRRTLVKRFLALFPTVTALQPSVSRKARVIRGQRATAAAHVQ